MALVNNPDLLIADEPTTALDVTTQAQILGLIKSLQREIGCAVLLITHDFGVVAQMADDVAVMHRGEIIERGPVREVLRQPQHAHTQALLNSLTGSLKRDLPHEPEQGDMVAVAYDKLFAITSCVAGVQELVAAAQRNIAEIEAQLSKPLRNGGD